MGFAARRWGKVARRPKYALINTKKTEMEKRLLLMNSNGPMTNGRPAVGGRLGASARRGSGLRRQGLTRGTFLEGLRRAEVRHGDVQPPRAILLHSRILKLPNAK